MGKWEMVRLGDVCKILNGYAFQSTNYISAGVRVIRITNVQKGKIVDDDPKYYPACDSLNRFALNDQDLLISLTGNVGRVGLFPNDLLPAYLNQRVACISEKKSEKMNRKYLFFFLNSDVFENACIDSSRGLAQKNMSTEWLKEYQIPLPPLPIQQKIADVLDRASTLIEKRKVQIEKLDLLVKSRFIEMFGDPVTNPMGWEVVPFLSVATIDTHMTSDFELYAECPHIGIENIERDTGALISYKTVKESGLISGKYPFDERHIIYSKIRPNLNKVALPSFKGLCSADAYPILPNSNCTRLYLALVMRSDLFLEYILGHSGRTNIPKVNKIALGGFSLPLPPLDLQNRFADFVRQTDKSKFEMKRGLENLQNLYKSLEQKYFSGEIF